MLYLLSKQARLFKQERIRMAKRFFAKPPSFDNNYSLKQPVVHNECHHAIESLTTLRRLLAEKSANKEDPVLRFLVDVSGIAWFARETRPGVLAPKHFQMTGKTQREARCQTAGNLKFTNSSCRVLKNINHRSGDFHPSFCSLRLFIAILILNETRLPFKLRRTFVIKEFDCDGEFIYKHRWSMTRLRAWVATFSHNSELIKRLTNQDVQTNYVYYKSTIDNSHKHAPIGKKQNKMGVALMD